jgi:hypothetical protein
MSVHRLAFVLVLTPLLFTVCGCTVNNKPSGGGYKSAIAQTIYRLAINEALEDMALPEVDGRKVTVRTVGFDGDQDDVREYLRYRANGIVLNAGGEVVTEDPEINVDLVVHTCGIDSSTSYIAPIWLGSQVESILNMDLVVSDDSAKVLKNSKLTGRAMFLENTWLIVFATPGYYQIMRDGSWYRVDDAWSDLMTMFDIPVSLSTIKDDQ